MDPFSFTVDDFDVEWLTWAGMARGFDADLSYTEAPGEPEKSYDLRVNHPLKIGGTELFLIGHGYAPVVTVRDGDGNVAASGPVPFLPMGPDLFSFGVIKAPDAKPGQIGLEGYFYPTFANVDGTPVNLGGNDVNPLLSLNVYTGDLNLDSGASQSVYTLDKSRRPPCRARTGSRSGVSLAPGDTVELPNGLGSVTFDKVVSWQRIQISQTPGKDVALLGVVLALLGLMGSLFIRSRRVWLRVTEGADGTLVEIAALDRSGGADTDAVLSGLVAELQGGTRMTDAAWGTLSNQAVAAAAVVYFLALLAHVVEWSSLRQVDRSQVLVGAGGSEAAEPPAAPDVEQHRVRVAMFGRLALLLTGLAVAVHLLALVGRGMSADPNRVPWGNMYEFTLAGTFVVAAFYLVMSRRYALDWLGPVVVTFVLALLMVAVVWLYDPTGPLPEALNSHWLVIHVVSAILGDRRVHPRRDDLGRLPAQAASRRGRPADRPLGPGPVAREARPDLLPDPRLRASRSGRSRS